MKVKKDFGTDKFDIRKAVLSYKCGNVSVTCDKAIDSFKHTTYQCGGSFHTILIPVCK